MVLDAARAPTRRCGQLVEPLVVIWQDATKRAAQLVSERVGELHGLHLLLPLQRRQRVVLGADRDGVAVVRIVVLLNRDPKRLDEARVGHLAGRHPLRLRTALPGGLDEVLLPSGRHPLREHARLPRHRLLLRNRTDGAAQAVDVFVRSGGDRATGLLLPPVSSFAERAHAAAAPSAGGLAKARVAVPPHAVGPLLAKDGLRRRRRVRCHRRRLLRLRQMHLAAPALVVRLCARVGEHPAAVDALPERAAALIRSDCSLRLRRL
mmetsp:Transcript_2947/g.8404  ORF Transcript_2947/g.8404 Transcript_2947/m.8404 type:complete len:264 (+) Transcript_2947:1196-1987(+)